jgi:orotidine 5'-phosphate decarboxylase subfamily 2
LTEFTDKFSTLAEEKSSILCIGLDPALPSQRPKDVINTKYLKNVDENEARLNFCLDIVKITKDYCCAFKPNQQYVAGFTKIHHQKMTDAIRKADAISILDYKLNDIGDTVESALFHIHQWGYDAVTFNPFLGNTEITVKAAHKYAPEIGIIVLVLTSNTEAIRYQKEAMIRSKPVYLAVAEDVKKFNADGCVVGATGHVTKNDIAQVRATIGDEKVLLIPGVGAQRGDPEKAIKAGGRNVLVNVGRDIVYSNNPKEKAKSYSEMFQGIRKN